MSHSEHGDPRYPALRVLRTADTTLDEPSVVAEKWDGEGRGLHALEFGSAARRPAAAGRPRAPRPRGAADLGRRRRHRDRDRARPARRRHRRLVPRRLGAAGRPRPRRPQRAVPLRPGHRAPGEAGHPAGRRPRRHRPPRRHGRAGLVLLRAAAGDPPGRRPRRAVGERRGAARRLSRSRTAGCPARAATSTPCWSAPRATAPYATAFLVHGGPESLDDDSYRARRAAYVDAGYAVVHVNYRGSTGYGSDLAGRAHRPARADRARGRRRRLRRAGRRGRRRPAAGAALRRLVGRVPHPARPRHPAGALGGGHRRGAGGRLPGRVRGRDGGPAGLRPGAVRRLTGGGARRLRAVLADHLRGRRRRAGARGRRRQRPALPDPADRQLPGRAGASWARSTRSTGSTPATGRWSSRRPSARSRSRCLRLRARHAT